MRDPRRWLWCLPLVFLSLVPVAAQERRDGASPSGGLHFMAAPHGDARVTVWLTDVDDPRAVLSRVRGTLPCTLDDPGHVDPQYTRTDGVCPGLFRNQGSLTRGRLDLAPFLRVATASGLSYLSTSVDLPDAAFRTCGGWSPIAFSDTDCMAIFGGIASQKPTVEIVYGFRAADLAWRFGLTGALVLAPIPLLLRRRRRVLAAEGEARLNAWFDYWRAYRAIHLGGWMLWVAGVYTLRLDDWTAFVAPGAFTHQLLLLGLLLLPPALVFLTGHHLSQPVIEHVRELARPRREARREALSYLLLFMVPFSCTLVGLGAIRDGVSASALWLLAGFVLVLVGRWVYARVTRLFPHALTPGDLRQRIAGIARSAGVRLQEVYILPAAQRRMANAFATSGHHVVLTDYLVSHLSRRELDAVVAHEVGHLRRRHLAALLVILVAVSFGLALAWQLEGSALESIDSLPLLALACVMPLRFLLRRFERSADAQAARLTNDPEAMISALGKLARLSLLPLRWTWWDDMMSTHPSMIRRGEALARRSGLPRERMERLLRGEDTLDEPEGGGYELPAATLSPERVFTTLVKTRAGLATLWSVILACVLSGVLPSWAIHRAGLGADQSWGLYALALAGGFLAVQMLVNRLALRGYADLGPRLAERLEREGLSVADGVFAGFAPDDSPRLYEGQGVWDVGFLVPGRDGFAFLGDQARFRLRRDQVTAVRLGPGTPGWWRVGSVYVDWRSAEGFTRTFHLRGRGRTLWQVRRSTKDLADRLTSWLESPAGGELPELPPPPVVDAGGLHPREALRPRLVLYICYLILVLCAVSSMALQDWRGLLTAPVVGIAVYLAHLAPYWFAKGKDQKDFKDPKDIKNAA